MAEPLVVVAATANAHKLDEMRAVFGAAIELLPRPEDLAEVVEDADTFVGNARLKAVAVAQHAGHAALADDSGLEVDALDGEPGVQSAYYGGGDHDDAANRDRLRRELRDVEASRRTARFRTVMVLRWPDGREVVADGSCEGTIIDEDRGDNGFGYDAMFVPADGDGRTFGEYPAADKNAMSHRSRACRALLDALAEFGRPAPD
ncbi:MAG: non-canonical purine NTP pyrophosphatase [Actinomycetota bacterium]